MALNTAIRWCRHTWNPWQGCHRISEECDNCYMYRDMARYGKDPKIVRRSADATFNAPLSKKYEPGDTVFICSWSDFLHKQADEWRADAFAVMRRRPDLRYIVVTKRIERAEECWPDDWRDGWPNVAVLVTAGYQEVADERIPILLKTRAAIRGVSIEPMLGPLNITEWIPCETIGGVEFEKFLDWIIVGGESGPNARPMNPRWARDLRDQCAAADVPFFFKQWGEWIPGHQYTNELREIDSDAEQSRFACKAWDENDTAFDTSSLWCDDGGTHVDAMFRVGTKRAGHLLDGVDHSAYPKAWANA